MAIGSSAADKAPVPRFRRRLTAAFVAVAAGAAGALALITYLISTAHRTNVFESSSRGEASLALALAPDVLDTASFARLQAAYESRTGASTLARAGDRWFSSSPGIGQDDIPAVVAQPSDRQLLTTDATIDGVRRYVVAARHPGGDYWFFFSRKPVTDGLRDLRSALLASWLLTAGGAALAGRFVARTTLQPVRAASTAAQSLAAGLLETRLEGDDSDDEFGRWSASFNQMADALQRTIDRLEAAAARERRFTADIAHELRTPLTTMSASASLLEDDVARLPAPAQRAARLLIAEVHRLKDLVLELLELARLDAAAEPVRTEALDLSAALDAVVRPALAAHAVDGGDVRLQVPHGLPVEADRARLRRVLHNLVDNALRHGATPVDITATAADGWTVIDVRDRGPGLSVEDPAVLFDRFAKSDHSRAEGGSGLGLAIAAGHAAAMGGRLTAADAPGGGAVFRLCLPRSARRDPGPAPPGPE